MIFSPYRFAATAILAALSLPALAMEPAPTPASPASAVSTDGPRQMRAKNHRHNQHNRHYNATPAEREQHMVEHSAQLKKQLQITPAQEAAWASFTSGMKPSDHARLGMGSMENLTVIEHLERMQAIHTQRGAEMERRAETVKAFYAVLTPAQQKILDAHHREHHRAMHRGPNMGMMMGMGGMGMEGAGPRQNNRGLGK